MIQAKKNQATEGKSVSQNYKNTREDRFNKKNRIRKKRRKLKNKKKDKKRKKEKETLFELKQSEIKYIKEKILFIFLFFICSLLVSMRTDVLISC